MDKKDDVLDSNFVEQAKISRKRDMEILIEKAEIPPDLMRYGWEDYKTDNNEQTDEKGNPIALNDDVIQSRKRAVDLCGRFAWNICKMGEVVNGEVLPFASLLLIGTKGSGKSVLGGLILRVALQTLRDTVRYVSFTELISELQSATVLGSQYKQNVEDVMDRYYGDPRVLMIDEIDYGHYVSNAVQEHLCTILTRRADWQKPTIITSKLPYRSLASVIGLPASRVVGKPEVYVHIHILNNKYASPDDLLSAERKYSADKCKNLLLWLKEIIKLNQENRTGTGLYGHQIRECLESSLRFTKEKNLTKEKIINRAMGIVGDPTETLFDLEDEDIETIKSRERHEKEVMKKRKESIKDKKKKISNGGGIGEDDE